MTAVFVLIGGAVGAPLRYLLDQWVQELRGPALFPWGTFVVNALGSFLLGLVLGADPSDWVMSAAGTGFCGALTTFSTFGFETVRLLEAGEFRPALLNVAASFAVALAAVAFGYWLGS